VLSFPFIVRCGRTTSPRSGGAPRTAVPPAQEDLPVIVKLANSWLLLNVGGGLAAVSDGSADWMP
jgi:hypothetical protein